MSLTHLDECPKGRSESYPATGGGGEPLTVSRCIDCGVSTVGKGKDEVPAKEAKPKDKAEPEKDTAS